MPEIEERLGTMLSVGIHGPHVGPEHIRRVINVLVEVDDGQGAMAFTCRSVRTIMAHAGALEDKEDYFIKRAELFGPKNPAGYPYVAICLHDPAAPALHVYPLRHVALTQVDALAELIRDAARFVLVEWGVEDQGQPRRVASFTVNGV